MCVGPLSVLLLLTHQLSLPLLPLLPLLPHSYCRKARRVGLVPGVVLGMLPNGKKADPILVWARESEVKLHMRERGMELESTLYDITIGDETLRVLPRQLALHPGVCVWVAGQCQTNAHHHVSRSLTPYCCCHVSALALPVREFPTRLNFVRYIGEASKRGARIAIPFRAVNQDRCPAIKEGGWLLLLQHRVRHLSNAHTQGITMVHSFTHATPRLALQLSVFAKGPRIPNRIIIDLRGKKAGSKIMASELYLNEGLMLRHPPGADKVYCAATQRGVGVDCPPLSPSSPSSLGVAALPSSSTVSRLCSGQASGSQEKGRRCSWGR